MQLRTTHLEKYLTALLLAFCSLCNLGPAAAQSTAWVLLKQDDQGIQFNNFTYQDKDHQPVRVPKQLKRYILKNVVVGGQPGQLPAQQLNLLIGRTAEGSIAFVPATALGSLTFRAQDMLLFPATKPTDAAPPTFFRVQVPVGSRTQELHLFPGVYPNAFTFNDLVEQELFLSLGEVNDKVGALPLDGQLLPLRVNRRGGLKNAPLYTPTNVEVRVADGQHERQLYHVGEPFQTKGYLITPKYVSPGAIASA